MPGVFDRPIGDGNRDNRYRIYDPHIIRQTDMRSAFTAKTVAVNLAEHFAVAEFVLLNNISGSITIAPQQLYNVDASGSNVDINFDEHNCGNMVSVLANTLYNRAFAGCMLELIDRLKAANLFNETVIDVRGEFGRYGREDGSGSDHADTAGSLAIYNGLIEGPVLIGNTRTGGAGTVGDAAPVDKLNGETLDMGHITSSLATMLRVPSPVTARQSIVAEQNGKIVPLIEPSKQV